MELVGEGGSSFVPDLFKGPGPRLGGSQVRRGWQKCDMGGWLARRGPIKKHLTLSILQSPACEGKTKV